MLGDLILETLEKATGTRVLDQEGTIELSVQGTGKLLGTDRYVKATRWATPSEDGTLYGEGCALIRTYGGDFVKLNSTYIVTFKGPAMSVRGIVFFNTKSSAFKRLNAVVGVFEGEQNQTEGTGSTKAWE